MEERKKQLTRISQLRGGRAVLVFAANLNAQTPLISMDYSDLLPLGDQLSNLSGDAVDIILESHSQPEETWDAQCGSRRRLREGPLVRTHSVNRLSCKTHQ